MASQRQLLTDHALRLVSNIQKLKAANDQKYNTIQQMKSRQRQGVLPDTSAANLQQNMGFLPEFMRPGNVGSINEVIWPYWFTTTQTLSLAPDSMIRSAITVTQEAAFVLMGYSKSVFVVDEGEYTYIDPDNAPASSSPGLAYLYRDAQSTREFFDKPQDLEMVGNPRFPTILPAPQLFLPNSVLEVNFFNSDPVTTYAPSITFFGYRIRIEKAKDILSLITG